MSTHAKSQSRRRLPADAEKKGLALGTSTHERNPLTGSGSLPPAPEYDPSLTPASESHDFGKIAILPMTAAPVATSQVSQAHQAHQVQTQLRVSQPGDPHEQEADAVAEQVMRLPDTATATEGNAGKQPPAPTTAPEAAQAVPEGGGQPLDAATRAFMEPRFGHDFGQVRVHTDAQAAEAAEGLAARAYTVGRDIVFGAREYAPETTAGRHLLAHELTHVVQQGTEGETAGPNVLRQPAPAAAATDDHESDETMVEYLQAAAGFVKDMAIEGLSFLTGTGHSSHKTTGQPSHKTDTADKTDKTATTDKTASAVADTTDTTDTEGEPDRAEIAKALASIAVTTRTQTKPMLHPWEIFQLMPQNTVTKKHLYLALKKAATKLREAEAQAKSATGDAKKAKELETAQTKFHKAVQDLQAYVKRYVLGHDRTLRRLRAREVALDRAIKRLKRRIAKAKNPAALQQNLEKKTVELAQIQEEEKSRHEGMVNAIESQPDERYELADTTKNTYRITVDGATVSLRDHVDAYCTVVANGLTGRASAPKGQKSLSVSQLLEKDPTLSPSRKKILQMISHFEGGFSTMNTYDRAVLTWGMVQWTGGKRSDLTKALAVIKRTAPEAFAARFQKYGLDIDEKGNELIITPPTGSQIRGDAAAQAIQDSPKLTAVMSAAGTDPEIQLAELKAANELEINRALNKHLVVNVPDTPIADTDKQDSKANKKLSHRERIRVRGIFTSEAGVGVIANQTVHGGFPARALHAAIVTFVKDKGWHPDDPAWIASAEQALIIRVSALDRDRAAKLRKELDSSPGSFR